MSNVIIFLTPYFQNLRRCGDYWSRIRLAVGIDLAGNAVVEGVPRFHTDNMGRYGSQQIQVTNDIKDLMTDKLVREADLDRVPRP